MLHVVHIKIHKFIIKNGRFSYSSFVHSSSTACMRFGLSLFAGIWIAPPSLLYLCLGVVRLICRKLLLSDVKQLTG